MAPPSSIQFIDAALSPTSPFPLSYSDPDQKWLIRKHLLSLFQDYPSLSPSIDSFTHNDGATVNLLNATGDLFVSQSSPPIPLTIWLHENYPHVAPIVFISPPIHPNHPFVDPSSGAATCPYLETWQHPRRNLTELVHNLVNLFSRDHPFSSSPTSPSFTHPSLVSKREALDRLAGALRYDITALTAKNEEEIEELSKLQDNMVERSDITTSIVLELEYERMGLKGRVKELVEEADVVMNWLRVNDIHPKAAVFSSAAAEDAFEAADEESKLVLDNFVADRAIEDLIYALEKAVEQGAVTFEVYIKQVRVLAREQFYHRAMLVKLKGPQILNF